ncbi:hypothetical protein CTEN210_16510 [Chaetoceros tenuissimus]|uniref:Uncharacterized protein n=1 Tax=Chaetoceros tenuissimus TaxID=426638 RepID=A0AAD3HEC7_9STRA|nr:hypothetical protein CTEN210_16510 [Chaetoceros tenuissimus]
MLRKPGSYDPNRSSSRAQSSTRRKTAEGPDDLVRKLTRLPGNKKCADYLLFLVTLQGFLTLFGNTTCMIAAYRIAKNSGWPNLDMEQIQEEKEEDDDDNHNTDIENIENVWKKTHRESFSQMTTKTSSFLFIKLMMIVPFTSYVVKYGELFLTVPFHPKPSNAIVSIFVIPLIVALYFTQLSCKVYELQSEFNDEIVDEETSLLQ